MHDIRQCHLPMYLGLQYPPLVVDEILVGASGDSPPYQRRYYDKIEYMSSYAPGYGQHFGQYEGGDGDEKTIKAGKDGKGGNFHEGRDVEGEEEERDQDEADKEEEGSEDGVVVLVSSSGLTGRVGGLIE